jgi:hypothetical protein
MWPLATLEVLHLAGACGGVDIVVMVSQIAGGLTF